MTVTELILLLKSVPGGSKVYGADSFAGDVGRAECTIGQDEDGSTFVLITGIRADAEDDFEEKP